MKTILISFILIAVLLTSGCISQVSVEDKQSEAQVTAERFARYWEQKDWNSMYDMIIPELQQMKTKQNFYETMDYLETSNIVTARLDKVSLDADKAYVYLTATTGLYESKVPALELHWINNTWKFNAFYKYFDLDLQEYKDTNLGLIFISTAIKLLQESRLIISDFTYVYKLYGYSWSTSYCNDFRELNIRTNKIYEEASILKSSESFDNGPKVLLEAITPLKEATEYMVNQCGKHPRSSLSKIKTSEARIIELQGILNPPYT